MTEVPEFAKQFFKYKNSSLDEEHVKEETLSSSSDRCNCITCHSRQATIRSDPHDIVSSTVVDKESTALYKQFQDSCCSVGDFMEKQPQQYFDEFLIPEKFFKRFWVMDLVTAESRNTCCFTKG